MICDKKHLWAISFTAQNSSNYLAFDNRQITISKIRKNCPLSPNPKVPHTEAWG